MVSRSCSGGFPALGRVSSWSCRCRGPAPSSRLDAPVRTTPPAAWPWPTSPTPATASGLLPALNPPYPHPSRGFATAAGRRGGMADAEDLKSSGGEPPCGFESHRRYSTGRDRKRQNPLFSRGFATSTPEHSSPSSRQRATQADPKRPSTATENATGVLPADPELAAVIDAWDRLPEAVRAGILAMVRAAAK